MNLYSVMTQAGWAMIPLVLCSVWMIAAVVRAVWLFRLADPPSSAGSWTPEPTDPERSGDEGTVRAGVIHEVLEEVDAIARRSPAALSDAADRIGNAALEPLERSLIGLALLAQVAPLLGLLGTVVGMIELFGALERSTGAATAAGLAGGIWKALLTTAAGMSIAIPALVVHGWCVGRLQALRARIEEGIGQILVGMARR